MTSVDASGFASPRGQALQRHVARQQQIRGPDRRGDNADGEIPNCSHKLSPRRVVTSNPGGLRRRRHAAVGASAISAGKFQGRAESPQRPGRDGQRGRRGEEADRVRSQFSVAPAASAVRAAARASCVSSRCRHAQGLHAERFLVAHPE